MSDTQSVTDEWKVSGQLGVITTDSAANMLGLYRLCISCISMLCLVLSCPVLSYLTLPTRHHEPAHLPLSLLPRPVWKPPAPEGD